jgi:hypothetical protein
MIDEAPRADGAAPTLGQRAGNLKCSDCLNTGIGEFDSLGASRLIAASLGL